VMYAITWSSIEVFVNRNENGFLKKLPSFAMEAIV
jgi:hypothetical protein